MKRIVFTAIACTLAASASLAAPAPKEQAVELRLLAAERVSGTIMNVNLEGKSFVVMVQEKELSLTFDAKTKFLLDGKEVDPSRLLQIGGKVTVNHEKNVATSVEGTAKSAGNLMVAEKASGTIKSISSETKSFVIVSGEKDLSLTWNEKTKFLLDGKEVDASRLLQIGGKVTVSHEKGVVSSVEGTTKPAGELMLAEKASGTIKSVSSETKTFVIVAQEKDLSLTWNEKTKFMLDGKEVDASRLLQIGGKVTVSHEKGVVSSVEGTTKPAGELMLAEKVSGTVKTVSSETHSFVVVAQEKELSLTYNDKTQFLLDGKEVDAAHLLQIGSKITVSHEKNVALTVEGSTKP
jgi:hypothetical protein